MDVTEAVILPNVSFCVAPRFTPFFKVKLQLYGGDIEIQYKDIYLFTLSERMFNAKNTYIKRPCFSLRVGLPLQLSKGLFQLGCINRITCLFFG